MDLNDKNSLEVKTAYPDNNYHYQKECQVVALILSCF